MRSGSRYSGPLPSARRAAPAATKGYHRMKRPSKTVTSIGVVAFVIAAVITGLAGLGTAWSGYERLGLLFIGVFVGVLVLGVVLDRAARNAAGGGRR